MKKVIAFLIVAALVYLPQMASGKEMKEEERVENAGKILKEILDVPENIPQDLLNKARCVAVLPSVLKFAIGVGGSYGRGVMTCRTGDNFDGPWGAPSMIALEGGSFGLQLGGEATDFVLLVMNPRGADSIISSKVKLGADISAAAGPKGRTAAAESDVTMRSEILTYSRARGLFAGVSLEGSTLRPDNEGNRHLYGREIGAREILREGKVTAPPSARQLVDLLDTKSPKYLAEKK